MKSFFFVAEKISQNAATDFARHVHRSRNPGRTGRATKANAVLQDERGTSPEMESLERETWRRTPKREVNQEEKR